MDIYHTQLLLVCTFVHLNITICTQLCTCYHDIETPSASAVRCEWIHCSPADSDHKGSVIIFCCWYTEYSWTLNEFFGHIIPRQQCCKSWFGLNLVNVGSHYYLVVFHYASIYFCKVSECRQWEYCATTRGVIIPEWNSTATVLSGSPGHVGLVMYKAKYIAVATCIALLNSYLPKHNGGITDDYFKGSFDTENWLV